MAVFGRVQTRAALQFIHKLIIAAVKGTIRDLILLRFTEVWHIVQSFAGLLVKVLAT